MSRQTTCGKLEREPVGEEFALELEQRQQARDPGRQAPRAIGSPVVARRRVSWCSRVFPSCVVISIACALLPGTPVLAAEALGELEEPGQVERRPVDESSEDASESREASESGPKPAVQEEAKPDGEDPLSPTKDVQQGEATAILPDSEAVDDSIVKGDERDPAEKTSAAHDSTSGSQPPPRVEPQWSIRWQNAFIVERVDDPSFQFLFGGRIQNDWGAYVPDNDLDDSLGGDGTGVKFRRARLYFQGQFFRYGFFKAEYDFAGSDGPEFTDVYAGLSGLPRNSLLRVGQYKEPFSLEFENSSNFMSFNERAGIQVFSPGRNVGIMLNGNLIRNMTYAVSFNRRSDDLGEGFSGKEDYHLTARLTGLPYFEEGGARLVHLELGYSHQFADKDEGTRYDIGVANSFSPIVIDTGTLPVEKVDLFNFSTALVEGSFSVQGEATMSLPRDGISAHPIFWGAYAQASWWLTGEHRRYLRGRGVFSRVVPNHRFDLERSHWGAFELALRYSWVDLSNDGIRGGTLGEWSFAANWVLFSNMRVSNNFVFSDVRDRAGVETGYAYSWVTRFEVDF